MAIGDTVSAGLLRTDFSPFNRAGVARGNVGYLTGMAMGRAKPSPPRSLESNLGTPPRSGSPTQNMERNQQIALQDEFLRRLSGTKQTDELTPEAEEKLQKGIKKFSSNDPRRKASVNDIEKFTQRIKNDPKNYKTVNISDLRGNEFLNQFRDDPRLFGMAFDFNSKRIEAELARQPKAPDPQVQIKNENDLRKEFNSLPEVKDFNKVRTSYDKVILAGENPSAAGDISMIFNYMKILDPGSVVREGEFATAQNAAGVPQRVINQYNKIVKGERLSEDQRSDFMNQARFAAEAQFKPVSEQMTRYQGVARNMGLRLDQVLPTSFLTMGEQLGQEFKTKPDSNSDANSIKTDQGDYSIEGLSVEAQ